VYKWRTSDRRKVDTLAVESHGVPDIGGPFQLVTHEGVPVTDVDLRGKDHLMYFGFTFCPDVCPVEIRKMVQVCDALEGKVTPVFVTVDPQRDTVGMLASYVRDYSPSLLGLTGTPGQCEAAAKAFRIYAARDTDEEDYLVDHSIVLYHMGPDNKLRNYYGKNVPTDQVIASMSRSLGKS
jgi:protein SCO1/2